MSGAGGESPDGATVLRAAERRPQPWKNGGGVTTEVIAFPPGAAMADFDWRISIAEITCEGEFSRFEGIDRILAVLQGNLGLTVEGVSRTMTPASEPARFEGEAPVTSRPLGRHVRDLNLMVRRGAYTGDMQLAVAGRYAADQDAGQDAGRASVTIVVAKTKLDVLIGDRLFPLLPLDAIIVPPGTLADVTGEHIILRIAPLS